MVDYLFFSRAATITYAESIEKLSENFIEVKPHCFAAVPRVYEKMLMRVQAAVEKAPALRRAIFSWGVSAGVRRLAVVEAGKAPGFFLRLKVALADRLVFGKIKARLGGRFRFAISGGAPLSGDVAEFFWAAGVEMYEGYGLTETSPVLTCNRPGRVAPRHGRSADPRRHVAARRGRRGPREGPERHGGRLLAEARGDGEASSTRTAGSSRATSAPSTRTGS